MTVERNSLVSCSSLWIQNYFHFFNPKSKKKFAFGFKITFTFSMSKVENVHLAHSHADTKDGVGSQLVLVVGAVQAQLKETKLVSLTFSHLRQNLP